jgi:hypothetical protein
VTNHLAGQHPQRGQWEVPRLQGPGTTVAGDALTVKRVTATQNMNPPVLALQPRSVDCTSEHFPKRMSCIASSGKFQG